MLGFELFHAVTFSSLLSFNQWIGNHLLLSSVTTHCGKIQVLLDKIQFSWRFWKHFAAAVCKFGPAGWSGRQLEILGVIIDYSYCDVRKWEKRSEPGGQQKSNQCWSIGCEAIFCLFRKRTSRLINAHLCQWTGSQEKILRRDSWSYEKNDLHFH